MALHRLKQVFVREETHPGTALSILNASYGKYYAIDPQMTRGVSRFERNIARDTLTMPHALIGMRTGRLSFGLEMCGQATTTPDVPTWDLLMRTCGMRSVATSYITTSAAGVAGSTGPLRHGETITQATTAATAIVLHDTYPSGAISTVYVYNVVGSPNNSAVWTGGTSGATFTPSIVPTDAGQSWFPVSKHTSKFTYTALNGTVAVGTPMKGNTSGARLMVTAHDTTAKLITLRYYSGALSAGETVESTLNSANNVTVISAIGQDDIPATTVGFIEDGKADVLYGARGNFRLNGKIGESVMMNFELYGTLNAPAAGVDQALVSGIAYDSKIPPVFLGANIKLGHEGDSSTSTDYTPRVTAIEINMNNELYIRESAALADGYEDCVVTSRNVSGSMDPELDMESSYPFFQDFTSQSSVPIGRMNFAVGSTAGNRFYCSMPGLQYDPPTTQSRNGVSTYQVPFKATGGYASTEVSQALGSDNEFCITYLIT